MQSSMKLNIPAQTWSPEQSSRVLHAAAYELSDSKAIEVRIL